MTVALGAAEQAPPAELAPEAGGRRFALASASVVLGLALVALGQYLFDERLQLLFERLPQLQFIRNPMFQRQTPAIVCLVVGSLLASAGLRLFVPPERAAPTEVAPPPSPRRRRLAWIAIALSALIAVGLVADILTTPFRVIRPLIFLASLVPAVVGCALLGRREPGRPLGVGWADLAWMLGAIGFFAAANAPTLTDGQWSIIGDEYAFFDVAYRLASGTPVDIFPQNAVYGVHPSFSSYLQALSMMAFGHDHFGWKMAGVVLGAAVVPPTYLTGLWLFGRTTARVAAAVVGCSHFYFAYAHSGQNNIDGVLPVMLTVCFLAVALMRPSPLIWLLAGASAGFSLYFFFAARVAGPILALGMLHRGWRPFWRGLPAALFGCLLMVAPFVATNKLATVAAMAEQGAPSRSDAPIWRAAFDSVIYTLWPALVFHYTNARGQHFVSLGFLDPVSAALGLLGTILSLVCLRDWRLRLLATAYFTTLFVTGGLSLHPHPTETRLLGAVPLLGLFGGVAVQAIQRWLERLAPRLIRPPVVLLALGGLCATLAGLNLERFYVFTPRWTPLQFEAVMVSAVFSQECRRAGPVPMLIWGERGGLMALAAQSYHPTSYLPLIVTPQEYWAVPAYQSWPCLVVANPDDAGTKRILAEAQAGDPAARLVEFTDGPVTKRVVAILRSPPPPAEAALPAAGRRLYAVHHTSPHRGSVLGAFREPVDLALGPDGRRLGLDNVDAVVTEFGADGAALRRLGGRGQLRQPTRLAADARGILVLEGGAGRVVELGGDGRVRASWDYPSLGLTLPRAVAIDPRGRVLIADEALPALVAFDRDLTPLGRLFDGAKEGGPQPFRPTDVGASSDGRLYLYDANQGRVRQLDADGQTIATWDVALRGGRLAVAPDGSVWIGAQGGLLIRRLGADGTRLADFAAGAYLGGGGEGVRGLAIDPSGQVSVLWQTGRMVTYRLQP